ncbi:MAG: hypothetical protein JO152_07175 [Mycobacteriaceae bacterium]|nr:hypothetical protein [Mycobacteriaceae bacterium]
MTSAAVRLVLVEGASGEGATVDHDKFDVDTVREIAVGGPIEHVVSAVTGTLAIAEAGGHRVRSTGLTWTDDAEDAVPPVLESFADAGMRDILAIPADEAAQALATGIAGLVECEAVGVCVVEPDLVMVVKTRDGAVIDHIDKTVNTGDTAAVTDWLVAALHVSEWQPERVFVVGSADGVPGVAAQLAATLPAAVVSAAEAELALARGAALASARASDVGPDSWVLAEDDTPEAIAPRIARLAAMQAPFLDEDSEDDDSEDDDPEDDGVEAGGKLRVPSKVTALTTLFVAAVVTFVVSLSVAVGLRFLPDHQSATTSPPQMANAAAEPTLPKRVPQLAPAAQPPAPAAQPPAPETLPAPLPEASPVASSPDAIPSQPLIQAPDAAQLQVPAAAPAVEPPAAAPVADPPAGAPLPPAAAPLPPPANVPPETNPQADLPPKHPILSRIPLINRIPGVRGPAVPQEPQVQQDPGVPAPPPYPPEPPQ